MHAIKNVVSKSITLSKDLMIKQLDNSHVAALFSLTEANRAYLKKWLPWVDLCISQSDTLNFITTANEALCNNSKLVFGMFFKEKISGIIGFNMIDLSSEKGEIGYWIGEPFQGMGLVTLACAKLVDIGFKQLGLKDIAIRCGIQNIKSQNIPMRLGFKKGDHVLKNQNVHGMYIDLIVYTIRSDEWPTVLFNQ